jgi:hypothetical protein
MAEKLRLRGLIMIPKYKLLIIGAILIVMIASSGTTGSGQGSSGSYGECDARCAPLDGEGKARCIKTCMTAKKKNAPVGESEVKNNMRDCEDRCGEYTGLDKIRCIRLCLDIKREGGTVKKKKEIITKQETPCEGRCAVLSGSLKDKCTARCEKESKFDGTNSSKINKK